MLAALLRRTGLREGLRAQRVVFQEVSLTPQVPTIQGTRAPRALVGTWGVRVCFGFWDLRHGESSEALRRHLGSELLRFFGFPKP